MIAFAWDFKTMFRVAGLALVLTLATGSALASPVDATAILKRTYENYRSQRSEATVAMTIHRPDWERHLELKSWTRGEDDALARFVAPAKDAGNATLKLNRETWVYNPKLNQVIKLPASMMSQAWMGSDFSYNDLAKSDDILTLYTHRLLGKEQASGHEAWSIEAMPKPGAPVVWGKVVMKIRDDYILVEETLFDQDMKPVRRMTTDKIGTLGDRTYPIVMTMHPLDDPKKWTQIETTEARFNIDLPDYLFTLSNLQNPRQ